MKKLLAIILATVMGITLAACGNSSTTTPENSGDQEVETDAGTGEVTETNNNGKRHLVFAWCVDNVDLSQQNFIDYAQSYIDYLNETRDDFSLEIKIMDGQSNVDKQISDVETAVAMGVDGIILSCVDPDGLTPAAQAAMEAGVPVIDWRDMGGVCTITFNLGNETAKGEAVADWLCEYVESNPDVQLKIGEIWGATSHPNCFPRMEEAKLAAEKYPDNIEFVVEQYGDWGADSAMKITEDWLQVHDLNCLIVANEEMMIGASEVLRSAGVLEDYLLITYNGEAPGLEMIANGTIQMDVGTLQSIGTPLLIEYAINMVLDGLTGSYDVTSQLLSCVTADNLEEYQALLTDVDWSNPPFESTLKDSYN